jgi:hypothetical protein
MGKTMMAKEIATRLEVDRGMMLRKVPASRRSQPIHH